MLQNARVTSFTVSELLRENQQGGGGEFAHPHKLGLKSGVSKNLEKQRSTSTKLCFHFQIFSVNCFCVYIIQFTFYQGLMVP